MDRDKAKQLGLSPLKAELNKIATAKTHSDIAALFGEFQTIGVPSPLIFAVFPDFKDNDHQIIFSVQAGLGIQRDQYINNDPFSLLAQENYTIALTKLFEASGVKKADAQAKRVVELEKKLAAIQWSNVDNRNISKTYNIISLKELATRMDHYPLNTQLQKLDISPDLSINAMQLGYLDELNTFFKSQPVSVWKEYLQGQLIMSYGSLLDNRFKSVMTDYDIERGLYIKPETLERQAIHFLNSNVGMMMGKIYVENKFDPSMKKDVTSIVNNIVKEYRIAIESSTRMTPETKQKALEKLEKMEFKIGYPDKWKDYSTLSLKAGESVENLKKIRQFDQRTMMEKVGKPIDPNDWDRPPQEINAFYNFTNNSFVLLAGILSDPFYTSTQSDAEKYGGIGFVIGHEIGHGFDDQGSQFDAKGNMVNWWQSEDAKKFDAIKQALIAQANAYEILPGKKLKGELEIGEIIGDLSGAEISFRAFQRVLKEKSIDPKSGYDPYFRQLAKTWRDHLRKEVLLMLIDKDPHPASEFRTNGIVRQFDEFHETFKITPQDKMYYAPEKRVKMW
jgi:putative endopeptidase